MSITGRVGLGVAWVRCWVGFGLQFMPPSLLFQIPGFATGGGVASGMSMAYMVLPSEAAAMALTSHGERMSFLSEMLPGVLMIAQRSTAVSGARAWANGGRGRAVVSKTREAMIRLHM